MKKMYWSAVHFRSIAMVLVALVSICCMCCVEVFKQLVPQEHYKMKYKAASLTQRAYEKVKQRRLVLGFKIDAAHDLDQSGIIGLRSSTITTDHGVLRSKQIASNPNIAALLIQWLYDLKLKRGDYVAVGMTGSFPGIDISTLIALQVMGLRPVIILSGGASNWGANIPNFNIIDMISYLNNERVLKFAPVAASIGGYRDIGKSLDAKGIHTIENSIKANSLIFIHESTVERSIQRRLQIYSEVAGINEIKAYINVGGGVASIGKHYAKKNLSKELTERIRATNLTNGVNTSLPVALANTDSVAVRYLKLGVPVINFKQVGQLALQYDLRPQSAPVSVGVGSLFFHEEYNVLYASLSLLIIVLACYGEMRNQRRLKFKEASEQLI